MHRDDRRTCTKREHGKARSARDQQGREVDGFCEPGGNYRLLRYEPVARRKNLVENELGCSGGEVRHTVSEYLKLSSRRGGDDRRAHVDWANDNDSFLDPRHELEDVRRRR